MRYLNDDFCIILDAGHGAISPHTLKYTTSGKFFRHDGHEFHDGPYIYEGISNRLVCQKIIQLCIWMQIPVRKVYHDYEDIPLEERVRRADNLLDEFPEAIGFSVHHNASPEHNASGLEAFTSPNYTPSDLLAEFLYGNYFRFLKNILRIRTDDTDGDHDKEARFYMVQQTRGTWVLSENGFYDFLKDALLIETPIYQWLIALSHVNAALEFARYKKLIG